MNSGTKSWVVFKVFFKRLYHNKLQISKEINYKFIASQVTLIPKRNF